MLNFTLSLVCRLFVLVLIVSVSSKVIMYQNEFNTFHLAFFFKCFEGEGEGGRDWLNN